MAQGTRQGEDPGFSLLEHMTTCLKEFVSQNGLPPERIIFYRDGVAHNQFEAVMSQEIGASMPIWSLEPGLGADRAICCSHVRAPRRVSHQGSAAAAPRRPVRAHLRRRAEEDQRALGSPQPQAPSRGLERAERGCLTPPPPSFAVAQGARVADGGTMPFGAGKGGGKGKGGDFGKGKGGGKGGGGGDTLGNVPCGTVVDTTITDRKSFDFYLVSQHGLKGTARPTHFHVLTCPPTLTADEIQQFTFDLCHVYARCTKARSSPPRLPTAAAVAMGPRCTAHRPPRRPPAADRVAPRAHLLRAPRRRARAVVREGGLQGDDRHVGDQLGAVAASRTQSPRAVARTPAPVRAPSLAHEPQTAPNAATGLLGRLARLRQVQVQLRAAQRQAGQAPLLLLNGRTPLPPRPLALRGGTARWRHARAPA